MHTIYTIKCLCVDNAECNNIIMDCFITRFFGDNSVRLRTVVLS